MPRNVVEGLLRAPPETPAHRPEEPRTHRLCGHPLLLEESLKTKGSPVAVESRAEGITYPPLDELLEKTDSKYSLVIEAARRARQINAYYSQLSEGALEHVGPLVETYQHEKPLSIALREINDGLLETSTVTVEETEA